MTFLHPEFLYYMLPPLLILFGFLITQKETHSHFFSDEVIQKLRVSSNALTLKARNALFLLIGVCIIVALAQPVIKDGVVKVKAKSADIMIALDISDSMLAEDVYPNRLKLAKQKALELLKLAPNERIGVIAFAKNSYLVSPLSFDHSVVSFLLSQLNSDSITEKGTDFLSMLEVVSHSLDEKNKKYLLVLSDGGDSRDFSKEIASAKEKNITLFVLGIGTTKGAPIKLANGSFIKHKGDIIISKLNENIAELATSTGGVYIQNSKSQSDIKAMLQEIEAKSEQKELKSEDVQRYVALFYYPVGLALFLLLLATSSMTTREKLRLPSAFILFALLFTNPHAEAGILDFMDLAEAKEAYEAGDYNKSAQLYKAYAESNKNGNSYYNEGNALYKQEKYDEAIEAYQQANFEDASSAAKKYANLGNAYVKQATSESLQKAVEAYTESLKIEEDKQTRENLEEVKKFIEKQKQESQKQENKEDKKQDKQENDKDNKSGEKKESSDKDSKEKEQKDSDKEKDSKEKEQKQDKESKSQNKKDEQQEQQKPNDMKSKEASKSQEKDKTQEKEQKEKEKQEAQKSDKEENKGNEKASANLEQQPAGMSDAEEQKWINELNTQKNTYLYKLNKQKPKEENLNEKPW